MGCVVTTLLCTYYTLTLDIHKRSSTSDKHSTVTFFILCFLIAQRLYEPPLMALPKEKQLL